MECVIDTVLLQPPFSFGKFCGTGSVLIPAYIAFWLSFSMDLFLLHLVLLGAASLWKASVHYGRLFCFFSLEI